MSTSDSSNNTPVSIRVYIKYWLAYRLYGFILWVYSDEHWGLLDPEERRMIERAEENRKKLALILERKKK